MKHTQGPWSFTKVENGFYISGTDDTYIADVHSWAKQDEDESMTKDNSSLIAAAPEMLEALELLNKYILKIPKHENIREATAIHLKAQEVIQKAKGL